MAAEDGRLSGVWRLDELKKINRKRHGLIHRLTRKKAPKPEQLKAYRVASRIKPAEPDPIIQPHFVEIPHPPTRLARWQERLQQRRDLFEQIHEDLADSEERAVLQRLLGR